MTTEAWISCALFILAISVNSITVYLQKKRGLYNRFGESAHRAHMILQTVSWLPFIVSLFWLEFSKATLTNYPFVGWSIFIFGFVLFGLAYSQIGMDGITNKDVFTNKKKILGGIYRYVPGPMYLSYTVVFVGWGMKTGVAGFYALALISLIGLQLVESRIERL